MVALGLVGAAYGGVWLSVDGEVAAHLFPSVAAAEPAELTVVLGAEVYPSGRPSPALVNRLDGAIAFYRAGKTQRLLMSGGHGNTEVDAMTRYATARGVPPEVISRDPHGDRTLDSCRNTRAVARGRVALVSQADHVRRAVFSCRRLGIDAEGIAVPDFTGARVWVYLARERFALMLAWWEALRLR